MNNKRKHIIFLARWYPNRYDPMFGLFVQRHAEAAALFNDITTIYVHADDNIKQRFDIERTEENNVETIRVYYKKSKNKLVSLIRFFRANKKALNMTAKPDMIHVHILTRLGIIAWFYKKHHGTPYIITEHWSRYLSGNDFHGFFRKKITRLVVNNALTITTVTENLAQAMKNHGLKNNNYVVLPNVVDVNMFQPKQKENNPPKIIHISCFEDKSKNISGLLNALRIIKDKEISFQCLMIGEGIDFERMKNLANELYLSDNVSFAGLLEGQVLADTLASGDFLVLSSNYENMPVVILEALSCGLPVVSTNVGGISEIINSSNGILVEPHNTEKLSEAIIKMLNQYQSYDSQILREQVIKKYSYEEVGRALEVMYK